MNREIHVRFWEGLGVRFPRATHCGRLREGVQCATGDDDLNKPEQEATRSALTTLADQ